MQPSNASSGFRWWIAVLAMLLAGAGRADVTPNYQGLWWASPAGSESGWGVNFTHHGDLIFATWFTYDAAGKASWLSMTAARTGDRTYSGALIRSAGPPFSAQAFDPASVARSTAGSGTLTFVDASNGTFAYTLDGVAQLKPITRQEFAPAPTCIQLPQPDLAAASSFQDLWWVPGGAESGWGVNFAHQGDVIFATWFTYDVDGTPLWLSATLLRQGASETYSGDLLRTSGTRFDRYDPSLVQRRTVGDASVTFADGNRATFAYSIADPSLGGPLAQQKVVTRMPFGPGDPTVCYAVPDPRYRVSGPSPFAAGCDASPAAGSPYANAEVEPSVAANPRDASHLIGVWQQDRWSDGGARGVVSAASFDGGRSWTRSMAPFSRCNGGGFERASDPWISIGSDGIAYQIALAFDPGGSSAILASRSLDGGLTWSAPATLIQDGADPFNDKESIAADPTTPGYAYAVWDRISAAGHGPTYFSRTTDGGRTWEPARAIYDPGGNNQTINNQTVVLDDGTLVTFFTRFDVAPNGRATATVAVIRSADKGATWSTPVTVSPVQSVGTRDPETGAPVRDGSNLGSIAAGPGGLLVAVWQDARFSGGARDGIALSRSTDRGRTWSSPVGINRDPTVPAFTPTVAIGADGTIGVTYFDLRSNTSDRSTLFTDYWLAQSSDGFTWRESRIAGPFDLAFAPNAGGLFLGDYQGLVATGGGFVPFYAAANTGDRVDPTNVFASLAMPAAPLPGALAERAQPKAAEGAYRAQSVAALPSSADLEGRLTASIARTMASRPNARVPEIMRRATQAPAP